MHESINKANIKENNVDSISQDSIQRTIPHCLFQKIFTSLWTRGPDDFAWRAKSRLVDPLVCYLLGLGNVNSIRKARFIRQQSP